MRWLALGTIACIALLGLGHWSGSQPERDAVAAATEELGVPFERRFVDVGEVTLHVVSIGPEDGPPVLLLHGFPEFWYAWRGVAAALADAGHRVILPDQRGYNRSDKPAGAAAYGLSHLVADQVGLLDALGHERAFVVAQDWGGAVAWHLAIAHPERVAKLVVIGTPHPLAAPPADDGETISWYRSFIQLPWIPGYTARLGNWSMLVSNLRATSAEGAFPDEEMDQYRRAWDRDGAIHAMAQWYRAHEEPDVGDGRVRVPTRILQVANDAFFPASMTRAGAAFLDDGDLVELGTGTHWVSGEEPERIGAELLAFFRENER